jgi:uncharacterized damage-inducible protein DinB
MPMWTPPDRVDPPYLADERVLLETFLDFHRDTLLAKCAGLSGEQLAARSVAPSGLSLLGLLRHLTQVERYWWRQNWQGDLGPELYSTDDDEDADFHGTDPARADEDLEAFRAELAASRAEAARHDLDDVVTKRRGGVPTEISLRWVYIHLIEEYARHNGHADLIRESIDGVTGE